MNDEMKAKLEKYVNATTGYYMTRNILMDFDGMDERKSKFIDMFESDLIGFDPANYSPEYQAAYAFNQAKMNGQLEDEQAEIEVIEAKNDNDISDAEWEFLVKVGHAERYDLPGPADFANLTAFRRTVGRKLPGETEEEMARKGL